MFYSHELLNKKSPLGGIWLAAHRKRMTRNVVQSTNILESCNSILNPEAPLALRLQALLATGVVIIYAKQATFLLDDCQKALMHVATVMNGQPATATLDGKVAQTADITLADEDPTYAAPIDLFPTFPSQLQLAPALSSGFLTRVPDELFIMPSIPCDLGEVSSGGVRAVTPAPHTAHHQYAYMPHFDETFEVPDMPDFDAAFAAQGQVFAVAPTSEGMLPPPEYGDGGAGMQPEAPRSATAPPAAKRKKGRKAHIDVYLTIQPPTDGGGFSGAATGTRHAHIARLLLTRAPLAATIFPGPASFCSGTVAPMFMEAWEDAATKLDAGHAFGPGSKKKRARGGVAGAGGDQEQGDPDMEKSPWGYEREAGQGWGEAPPGDGWDPVQEGQGYEGWNRGSGGGGGEEDVELERLRMALNGGTPGKDYMHLGHTPSSLDAALRGSKRGRGSSDLKHSDSGDGRGSGERSADGGADRRLSEILEGAWGVEGDAGAVLPPVGEDEPFLDDGAAPAGMRKRLRSGSLSRPFSSLGSEPLSQFQLLEESQGGTVPSLPVSAPPLERQTEVVLRELQGMLGAVGAPEALSLLGVTDRLERMQASRLFYQMLVCHSYGLVETEQLEPYGDIAISLPRAYNYE